MPVTHQSTDIRTEVDEFLGTQKRIIGPLSWVESDSFAEVVNKRSLVADGIYHGANLQIIAYPNSQQREFRILIDYADFCIARLDWIYEIDGPHINDFGRPMGYPSLPIREAHYHDWAGNRALASAQCLPKKLLYADKIDCKINTLEQGFWWFCQENNILATNGEVPDWPTTSRLI